MAGSIQFRGVDQVISAFQNRDVEAWSVWQHKQFMFRGTGSAELRNLLDILAEGSTNAIYTIKVYDSIKESSQIKEKTDCDGSFNFRLNDERQEITGSQYHNITRFTDLQKEISDLKLQLQEKENEFDEEPETIGAVVNTAIVEIIKEPSKMLQWIEIFKNLLNPGTVQPQPVMRTIPATIGNLNTAVPATPDEKLDRLAAAIDILEAKDPNLIPHLEKLAEISNKNPGKFKILLSMLETM